MSANPTRVQERATGTDSTSALQERSRVIALIGRHEALAALRSFSDVHEVINNQRLSRGRESEPNPFEAEGFVRDEVLRLICERIQALSHADGVIVALAKERNPSSVNGSDGSKAGESNQKCLAMICCAGAGALAVDRGTHLVGESALLRECLQSGRILRSDDCEIDPRIDLDLARRLRARSTVLVPLHGRWQQLGVLQVFSRTPWAFADRDIRCFELFADLLLGALKPEDEDRRMQWLADVADQILGSKSFAAPPNTAAIETKLETTVAASVAMSSKHIELPPSEVADDPSSRVAIAKAHCLNTTPRKTRSFFSSSLSLSSLRRPAAPGSARPGLSVVMSLVAVAALFSAGTWWGIAARGKTDAANRASINPALPRPGAMNTPPNRASGAVSDNLMSSPKVDAETAALTAVADDKLAALPKVTGVRHWSSSTGSTVVIDMEDQVPYEVHRLMSPERIYFDLHDTVLESELEGKTIDIDDPSLTRVRVAQPVAGVTRIVLDTRNGSNFSVRMESSPYRLVVELRSSEKTSAAARSAPNPVAARDIVPNPVVQSQVIANPSAQGRVPGSQTLNSASNSALNSALNSFDRLPASSDKNPAMLRTASAAPLALMASDRPRSQSSPGTLSQTLSVTMPATLPRTVPGTFPGTLPGPPPRSSPQTLPAATGRIRIVLDAGHGGWDLGTVGRQGLLEKDLVLDVTQRLGKLLQARLGSEVMFTRTDDTYLPLDRRADIANQAQADLFVSVHANYSTSAEARGVETYYTNLFSAPGAREVERGVGVDRHGDGTFARLTPVSLSAGGLHEKIEESRRLAASVQRSLYSTLAASSPDIRNRGIKDSAFLVLTGTTMPAILTEISFVSSPADERNLQSASYRQQIAEALYQGIARYEQASPHTKVAQLQTATVRP
jgi:N-acetylmuramoyl-L-alanine amidase